MPLPREHGAWSILAQPFLCSWILAGQWHDSLLAAAVAILALFLIRAPLVTLGRQIFVWRDPHPETRAALPWAIGLAALALLTVPILAPRWGWNALALFGAGATLLTAFAVWMEIRNRQRSIWLQLVTAAGLSSASLAAALSATGSIPAWAWTLWLLCSVHAAAGILVVRARLEARIAARGAKGGVFFRPACVAQAVVVVCGLALAASGSTWLAAALLVPSAIQIFELSRLRSTLDTPLTVVGLRAMTVSIAFSVLAVCGLWSR